MLSAALSWLTALAPIGLFLVHHNSGLPTSSSFIHICQVIFFLVEQNMLLYCWSRLLLFLEKNNGVALSVGWKRQMVSETKCT
jgi:hypothetical protein